MSKKHKTQHYSTNKAIVNFKVDSSHHVNSRLDSIESRLNKLEIQSSCKNEFEKIKTLIRRSHNISWWQAVAIAGLPIFGIGVTNFVNNLFFSTPSVLSWEDFITFVVGAVLMIAGVIGAKLFKQSDE